LIPFIGNRNRVHEILSRKRSLTLAMVRRLHEGLGIPAESLIKDGGKRAA
jgi:HTH-type transcriptional regulator/antitoxin HigA